MPDRRRGPHVFVDDLDRPVLADDDRHHLARVLRLRAGDPLCLSDGRGRWRAGRFGDELAVDGEVAEEPRPTPPVSVGFAPVKGQRPEWAVQKLTELGIDAVWLLVTERSVVRWEGDRATGHAARLAKVAREAAMQSRRCRLPEVRVGVALREAQATPGAVLADPTATVGPTLAHATVLVGPEGGWTDAERQAAGGLVALGPTVLRTETAAVAAGTLLTALRAGTVGPSPQ